MQNLLNVDYGRFLYSYFNDYQKQTLFSANLFANSMVNGTS